MTLQVHISSQPSTKKKPARKSTFSGLAIITYMILGDLLQLLLENAEIHPHRRSEIAPDKAQNGYK